MNCFTLNGIFLIAVCMYYSRPRSAFLLRYYFPRFIASLSLSLSLFLCNVCNCMSVCKHALLCLAMRSNSHRFSHRSLTLHLHRVCVQHGMDSRTRVYIRLCLCLCAFVLFFMQFLWNKATTNNFGQCQTNHNYHHMDGCINILSFLHMNFLFFSTTFLLRPC